MIVEDDSIVAHDIQRTLQLYGYEIFSIESSGESALKRFESENPDLVLMDIMLKGQIDGIETACRIHSQYGVPVMFITSNTDDALLQQAKKAEPFGFIIKPFQDRELKTMVEMVLYKARMEHILKEREEWLSVTLNGIGDGVLATDSLGKIFLINPVAERILGISKSRAIGEPIEKVFICRDGDEAAPDENPILSVIREGITSHSAFETFLFRPDREAVPIEYRITRIESARGLVMGAVMIFKDISETRKIQSELLKVQKLESIGRLAGGIAHEFNNVLTAVLGNVSLAKMYTEGSGEIYECLSEAEKASLRARDLAQKLMIFSKGGSPVKETASIAELIEESAKFTLEGSSVKCDFNMPLSLWPVEVDVNQMNQVISNVILNASEAMGGAGVIRVRAENFSSGKGNTSLAEGRYVKMEIADSGTGIPQENLSQLFDPYFSTSHPGKGMGLAICYSIIKRHGGHISIESERGRGTVVTIFVPASSEEIDARADSFEREAARIGRRILFLDDKEMVRRSAVKILSRLGYEVECANDGKEAVELYSRSIKANKVYDAVILDLTIPGGMGGKECIALLKQMDINVNAIASSGYSEDLAISDYEAYGFRGYLIKPYDVSQLKNVLHSVINKSSSAVREEIKH